MSWNDLRKGRFSQKNLEYFITFTTYQRLSIFLDHAIARSFCQQLSVNEQQRDVVWLAWVLMPDHFHGLVRLCGEYALSEVIKDLKGRSGFVIKKQFGLAVKCWQPAFYDRALRREDDRVAIARYIVANPLRAGLVREVGEYPYWGSVFLRG